MSSWCTIHFLHMDKKVSHTFSFHDVKQVREVMQRYHIHKDDVTAIYINELPIKIEDVFKNG
jgi:uncharacterized protein (UPF0179 family)